MNTYGEVIAAGTLRLERQLPGPIERVWSYLTESEKRRKWLAEGEMELRVGGKVALVFRNEQLAPPDEVVPEEYLEYTGEHRKNGVVTECDPPHRLSFTWGEDADSSEVRFELFSEADKVRLVITHQRLPDRETLLSVSGGWHTHVGVLENLLADRELAPFWAKLAEVKAEYERRIPLD